MQQQVLGRLIEQLAKVVEAQERQPYRIPNHESDVSLAQIASAVLVPQPPPDDHNAWRPLYDAAWELCRIGVLRPGEIAARGMNVVSRLGDYYSITEFGREWLKRAADRPFLDLSHLNEILQGYGGRFGEGYRQRAVEAVRSYQTCNYLAACVMCGAAAESILLALSIAKRGDENRVLAEYRSSRGRATVQKSVLGGAPDAIGIPLGTALEVMSYWRDDAGHGVKTTITLSHADQSLAQLIRLAQLASEHWDKLTGVKPDAPK
jgi:hypothetical protein